MTADILTFTPDPETDRCQPMAPEEAAMVATAEGMRMRAVRRAAPRLFGLRSEINRLDAILRDRSEAHARLSAYASDAGRDGWAPPFPPLFYWVFISAMLVLEVPVNAAALDLLRLPALESVMLALFMALANLLAAKYSGRVLRQWNGLREQWRSLGLVAIVNVTLLLALGMTAHLRAEASGHPGSTLSFLALQLLFYAVALIASCLHTPPCAVAEQEHRLLQRAARSVERAWTARARVARRHNVALERLQAELRAIEQACARRVFERRARLARGPGQVPAFFREPVTAANFQPLDLGRPVDLEPQPLGAVAPGTSLTAPR